jgi:hypothetical protein
MATLRAVKRLKLGSFSSENLDIMESRGRNREEEGKRDEVASAYGRQL